MRQILIFAAAVALLAACSAKSAKEYNPGQDDFDRHGLMVRHGVGADDRPVYLIFSADSLFEGAPFALNAMDSMDVKASFFFTGNFLRDSVNHPIIHRIIDARHFVGPHSDRHLLLADWAYGRPPLVSEDSLLRDTYQNYQELAAFGVDRGEHGWYLPPYEWASACHVEALKKIGLTPIAPTGGVMIFRDYTTPGMDDYWSSDSMLRQMWQYEGEHGLDGAFLIIHLGTQDLRTDKLYHHLPAIIDSLRNKGYTLKRLP